MTRVKICGITRESDLRTAVAAGADALGFLVDVPVDSPRAIEPARAAELVAQVPPFVSSVLVTMPGDPARVVDLARTVSPDVVQVHGDLGEGDVAYLRAQLDAALVKVVSVSDLDAAHRYADLVDALLVDSADEDGAGGTGNVHDWERTARFVGAVDVPVVLAGGLTAANVADAVAAVRPFAVDVASGVESCGGEKDEAAVAAFVRDAKGRRRPVQP